MPRTLKVVPENIFLSISDGSEIVIDPSKLYLRLEKVSEVVLIDFCTHEFNTNFWTRPIKLQYNSLQPTISVAKIRAMYISPDGRRYILADITYQTTVTIDDNGIYRYVSKKIRGTYLIQENIFRSGWRASTRETKNLGFNPEIHGFIWNKDRRHRNQFTATFCQ